MGREDYAAIVIFIWKAYHFHCPGFPFPVLPVPLLICS